MKKVLLYLLTLGSLTIQSQSDSIAINEGTFFNEGLYLSHDDFRHNKSVQKNNIETKIVKEQINFYSKLVESEVITYNISNSTQTISPVNIWGYVQNNSLFINYKGAFFRVSIFGSICYFAGIVEVMGYYTGIYDPMFGMGPGGTVKTNEVYEFLLNYYEGTVYTFSLEKFESFLKQDDELFKEYKSLKRRQRRKFAPRYARKFNEKHSVYVLN